MLKMKNYPIYQVDAFATQIFKGNPAAVCPLENWLDDITLQSIATENNLSETAFFVPCDESGYDYHIRWFTPVDEVDLCGHATLAATYIIFQKLNFKKETIRFKSLSGLLTVERKGDMFALNFPAWPLDKTSSYELLAKALGATPVEVYKSHDWLAVLESQRDVEQLTPDFQLLKTVDARGVIVTALADADGVDFVSRAFFPKLGIEEDPVTGSAHCALIPYWSKRLGKTKLRAQQISARLGELHCETTDDARIIIAGEARLYLEGIYYLQATSGTTP